MPKVPLSTITSGYGTVDALNANFDAIEAAFDNTLSRDGGTPNQMQANLDMNGNALLNVGTINGAPISALSDISSYVDTALAAATSASASATSAANTYDQFDDRYLGSKTSNPTVDNDGNALQVGAEYWNSVSNERRTWTGSTWVSSVTVVPDNSVTTAKLVDASVTTSKLADASVTTSKLASVIAPVVSSLNGGQLAGFRNKIINGKMEIAQRWISFPAIADGAYSLDRWKHEYVTSAVTTASQQADAPSNNEFQNSLRVAVTTADASIAAGDLYAVTQVIEGFNARDLIGRTFTLSFWVRSSKTGTHCVAFVNDGSNRSYVTEYTISAANTWEYKTVTVYGGLITAGSWDWTVGAGLKVRFALAAGSTFQATAGAWQTGNFIATANQVNCLDTVGNIFAITGVQLEVGASATPFEHRPYSIEQALCFRYYQRLQMEQQFTAAGAGEFLMVTRPYIVPMRVAPTFVQISAGSVSNVSTATLTTAGSQQAQSILVATVAGVCFVINRVFETSGTEL